MFPEFWATVSASGAGGALMTQLANSFMGRRKRRADTSEVLTRTAIELLDPLREELESARIEIRLLRARVNDMMMELESTQKDLRATRADLQIAQTQLRALEMEEG